MAMYVAYRNNALRSSTGDLSEAIRRGLEAVARSPDFSGYLRMLLYKPFLQENTDYRLALYWMVSRGWASFIPKGQTWGHFTNDGGSVRFSAAMSDPDED